MRVVQAQGYSEPRDAISHDWIAWFQQHDLEPVLIPNALKQPAERLAREAVSALLLTNGEDVHPGLYNEPKVAGVYYSPVRDDTETLLFEWALDCGLPVLAVCRGFQLVNVLCGGRLLRDITRGGSAQVGHVAAEHKVRAVHEGTRALAGGADNSVNSYHRQGVVRSDLGHGLVPLLEAEDGIVEAFGLAGKRVLGIQWHPERPGPDSFCQKELPIHFLREGRWW